MLIGALMYHLLLPPPGENSVSSLREHVRRLLRQTGFDISM
jgi:hypothetical protein